MINFEIMSGVLAPKKLTGIAIKKEQGSLIAGAFLPERPFPEWSGYYKVYNEVAFGQLAPEIAEGAQDTLLNTTYREDSFTMKEYRLGGVITERAISFLLSKDSATAVSAGEALVRDEIEFLTETIALRQEKAILDALVSNAPAANNIQAGNVWSDSGSDPVGDIRDAIAKIRGAWHVQPDTLIISPQVEMDLLSHADIKDIWKYSGSTTLISAQGISQACPKLAGLDVFVSDAVTMSGIAKDGTETGLVPDTRAIVCKRGTYLGSTYVAEPIEVRRWADEERRSVRVQCFKTFVPVIFRPKVISLIVTV